MSSCQKGWKTIDDIDMAVLEVHKVEFTAKLCILKLILSESLNFLYQILVPIFNSPP